MGTRGKYIVIEGLDGVGKSTQVQLLKDELGTTGINSIVLHEPGSTPVGDHIRTILKDDDLTRDPQTNLLLFTASRRESWLKAQEILATGTWVIAERNYLSTLAYQGYGEGLDKELILRVTKEFTNEQYMHPDQTIILTLPDEIERHARLNQRGLPDATDSFESRDVQFQTAVGQGYLAIANEYNLPIISAQQSQQEIAKQIYDAVHVLL